MILKEEHKPSDQFIFFRFKDTLKIDDFGGISEATYKLPLPLEESKEQDTSTIFIFGDDAYH